MIECVVLSGLLLRGYHYIPSADPSSPVTVSLSLAEYDRLRAVGAVESVAAWEARSAAMAGVEEARRKAEADAQAARELAEAEAARAAEEAAELARMEAEEKAKADAEADAEAAPPKRRSRAAH